MQILWKISVPVAALLGGLAGSVPILPLGLYVPGYTVWPLALGSGALFAALCGSWAGTLFAPDHTRSRLLYVIGISEALAVITGLLSLVPLLVPSLIPFGFSIIMVLGVCIGVVVLGVSLASIRSRASRGRLGWLGTLTLAGSICGFILLVLMNLEDRLLPQMSFVPSVGYEQLFVAGLVTAILSGLLLVWRFRGDSIGRDAVLTLGMTGAVPVAVIGFVSISCSAVVCTP